MRTAFTKKRGLYLLIALCCAGTIYFYPFLSSSITWMRNSHFRYENRTEVKLPFRWISDEGSGLALRKPASTLTPYYGLLDSSLNVHDHGPDFKPSSEGRARVLHGLGIIDSRGTPNEPTYPLTSIGLLCPHDNARNPDWFVIVCVSSDFRYSFTYIGRKEDIRDASEIARQVIR
jgi:hypothetical protein